MQTIIARACTRATLLCTLVFYVGSIFASELKGMTDTGTHLEIELNDGTAIIRPLHDGAVEVHYRPDGVRQLPSFGIDQTAVKQVSTQLISTESGYIYRLPEFSVSIQREPYRLSFIKDNQVIVAEEVGAFVTETLRGFRFLLSPDEQLIGGGQRVLGMDRRGHRMPLYNRAHYGYTTESNQMYYSLPAVMSTRNYAIGFDNSASGHLDIGHTEEHILQFEAVAGRTAYIFAVGDNMRETVSHFVAATGKQAMPPRWALGNYASRFGYRTQQEVLDVVDSFIEQDFPLDAVVLDLYWFGPEIKGHMGNLTWDRNAFLQPERMIESLSDKGIHTILITEPFILSTSSQWQSAVESGALAKNLAGKPRRFDFYFGNTGLVDVFDTVGQDWFWQYYSALNAQGVAGWWGDLGEPEVHPADTIHTLSGEQVTAEEIHNAYGHQWAKMVYQRQLQDRPNERPFVMMRAGFLGSQRYGMVPWTGDVARAWGGLQSQVELALQMGMFGLAYTHSDLGGFAGGEAFDPELYTRWMQYGVFQPVYRPHAQDHIAPEPIFHDEQTQKIVRDFIKLRYQLLPYNYSLAIENSLTGLPMMRPLAMHYPAQNINRTDAYLWGEQFIVAPIVNPGVTSISLALPKGVWFDYFTGQKHNGGNLVELDSPLEKLPVLVKAGAFVPKVPELNNISQYSTELLQLDYYHDASVTHSQYIMFDDDGSSPDSLHADEYQRLIFSSEVDAKLLIKVSLDGTYPDAPKARRMIFALHGLSQQPTAVLVDNKQVRQVDSYELLKSMDAVYWDGKIAHVSGQLVSHLAIQID